MIGLTVAKLLKQDSVLMGLVPAGNIFPYVANENIPLPLIIYYVDDIIPTYTKDGWANDEGEFSVSSYSENYSNLQDISKEVRNALEMKSDSGTGRITMIGFQEGFSLTEMAFVTKLKFHIQNISSY
jgi:hypothetical protein